MHALSLASRRSAAQSGLLATVCAVAIVLSGILTGLTGYLELSATQNTRAALQAADPTAAALQVETKLADDEDAQSSAMSSLLSREFAGVATTVYRSLVVFPLKAGRDGEPLTIPGGQDEARVTVATNPDLMENATLVDGAWPGSTRGGSVPGALQADAARTLGIAIGDELSFGAGDDPVIIEIVGTWRAKDADSPLWFADPGVATGQAVPAGDGTASFGPLMVDEPGILALGTKPFVHWTIALDATRVSPTQLDEITNAAANLRQVVTDAPDIAAGGVLVSGTLGETASSVQRALNTVRGVTPVGTLLAALMGLVTLVQLARLLSLARRAENALLRSRGASAQWLTVSGLAEAIMVAVIGSSLGFVAAIGVLAWFFGSAFPTTPALALAPWEYSTLVAIAVVGIYTATAWVDATRIAKRDSIDDSGRTRTAATIGTAVLALAGAGVAVWQSRLYGSPLVTNATGQQVVDPLAVVAPTLALVAIALTLLVAFGPLTDAWQRFATKRRGFQPSYSARQVARGLGSYAIAVLVIILAVGGLTVATTYSGSWSSLTARSAALTAGADVRVDLAGDLPGAGAVPVTSAPYLAIDGVTAAAPALSTPISMGSDGVGRLLALPSSELAAVLASSGDTLDAEAIAGALPSPDPAGVVLPDDTTALRLGIEVRSTDPAGNDSLKTGAARSSLWFVNSEGAVMVASIPSVKVTGSRVAMTRTIPIPTDSGPWRLVAIDVSASGDAQDTWMEITYTDLLAVIASGAERPLAPDFANWFAQLGNYRGAGWDNDQGESTISLTLSGLDTVPSSARLMTAPDGQTTLRPGLVPAFGMTTPVPLIVSDQLAERYGVTVGDPFDLRFSGTGITLAGTIAGTTALVPGIQSADSVIVDQRSLTEYFLRTSAFVPTANQMWLSTSGTVDLSDVLPEGAQIVTAQTAGGDQSFSAPAELALWIAAAGCLLLASISLAAVALAIGRSRRGEIVVLRAVGVSARTQARARLKELLAVVVVALLFGILNGLVVSWLTVSNLAKSAVIGVPAGLQAGIEFASVTGGAMLAVGLIALVAIALAYASRVRRQALDTDERLETG